MTEIKAEIETCQAAWIAAKDAIMEAWRVTPKVMLQTRAPVARDLKNQTIAYNAAEAMILECDRALNAIFTNAHARSRGYEGAVSDEGAVENRMKS